MNWMAGPRYLSRRHLVLKIIDQIKPKTILEIGFGNGDILDKLNKKGFKGKGIDFNKLACEKILKRYKNKKFNFIIEHISDKTFLKSNEKYDLVMALEVLEHIKDDTGTLVCWNKLINKNGSLLFSVPAHMHKWGQLDIYGGHIRRYEKKELYTKLINAGFKDITVYNYGFPLINITSPFRDIILKRKIDKSKTLTQRTKESGINNIHFKMGSLIFNDITLYPFYLLQNIFLKLDSGVGYICICKK